MLSQEEDWLLNEKYKGEKSEAFFTDLTRLQAGEPLAYIIGSIPFLDCVIHLDSKPLIPRTETEFWTEALIKEIKSTKMPSPKILDLCAGSGAIGVAIAHSIPNSLVAFSEIDVNHLDTIKKNCLLNNIPVERFAVVAGDLFSTIGDTLAKFDFIVSNPPYINPKRADQTEDSVKKYEPALALYGGVDGMDLIIKIINQAPEHLNQGGQLWLEHEPEQVEAIFEVAQDKFLVTTHKDQYRTPRFTQLVLQ